MEFTVMLFRTVLIYFTVFVMLRLMGKREIGKLSVFDLAISIMIAEMAVFVLDDLERPIMEGILPMAILVLLQILIAYISLKNQKVRSWFEGRPSVIIQNGKLNREEMGKLRYNLDDLIVQLRQSKVLNVADVEFAVLENNGKLTVIEKEHKNPVPPESQKIRYEGLPLPLIMDGKVQDDSLEKLGKTRFWLKNQLQENGARDFKEVFFCSIDHRGRIFLDKKK